MIAWRPFAARRHPAGVAARRLPSRAIATGLVAFGVLGLAAGCSGSSASSGTKPPSLRDVAALLARHGHAVIAHDRHAFLAGVDDAAGAASFRRQQAAEFDNLLKLPLTQWSYAIGARVDAADIQAAARRKYGAAVVVRVTLSYALGGVDAIPTKHDLWWTFVRRDGQLVVASDTAVANAGGASWKGPWDYGPLAIVRGASSLVIGHPDNAATLRTIADTVDAAVPAVNAVWGTGWSREVAVLVPSSSAELTEDLGPAAGSTAEVAAVATEDGQDVVSGKIYGQRLVLEPAELAKLSAVGRRITFRHEVTHIATAAATSDTSPRWLVEGFADYIGNLNSGQAVGVTASELRAEVRRHRVPNALPTDAEFDSSSTAAPAYEGAWLACRLIAQQAGPAALVHFYRIVGASTEDGDGAVAAGLRAVLHESLAGFVTQWRAYLTAQLG